MAIGTSTLSKEDVAAIEGIVHEAVRAVLAGDWAAYASLFVEDGVMHPPGGPAVKGRREVQAFGEAFPPIQDLSHDDFHVGGEGHFAYCTTGYRLTIKGAPTEIGKELLVLQRTDSGWKVVATSFNANA